MLTHPGAPHGGGVPALGAVEHDDVADPATRQGLGGEEVQRQGHRALKASRSLPKIEPSAGLATPTLGALLAARGGQLAEQLLLRGVELGRASAPSCARRRRRGRCPAGG